MNIFMVKLCEKSGEKRQKKNVESEPKKMTNL